MGGVNVVSSFAAMGGSARGSSGVGGSESSCVETELIESCGPPLRDCLLAGAFCGLGSNFNPSDPPSAGRPAMPGFGDTTCAGLLIRLGSPSMGRDAVNTFAPWEVEEVRERAGDCRRGVTFPDDERRGMPIMGPLGPGAYSPSTMSSIWEGGENQPFRAADEDEEEDDAPLIGEGVGDVGSA